MPGPDHLGTHNTKHYSAENFGLGEMRMGADEKPMETPQVIASSSPWTVGLVLRLAFAGFASVMAGYWLLKPYVDFDSLLEPRYVKDCKKVIANSEGVKNYRAEFSKLDAGETYRVGQPGQTTGYFTALRLKYGEAREAVYCFSDIGKQFTKAEITIEGVACIRYFPTGQRDLLARC